MREIVSSASRRDKKNTNRVINEEAILYSYIHIIMAENVKKLYFQACIRI